MEKKLVLIVFALMLTLMSQGQPHAFQWAKTFGGIFNSNGEEEIINNVILLKDGSILIGGNTTNGIQLDTFPHLNIQAVADQNDYFIARFDCDGQVLWYKLLGMIGSDYGYEIDTFNNKIIVHGVLGGNQGRIYDSRGDTVIFSNLNETSFFAEFDLNGTYLNHTESSLTFSGGLPDFDIYEIILWETSANYLYYWGGGRSANNKYIDFWGDTLLNEEKVGIFCRDTSYQERWFRKFPDSGTRPDVRIFEGDGLGNLYVGGFGKDPVWFGPHKLELTGNNREYMFLVKYNPQGKVVWAKRWQAFTPVGTMASVRPAALTFGPDGDLYISGGFFPDLVLDDTIHTVGGDVFILRLDSAGNQKRVYQTYTGTMLNNSCQFGGIAVDRKGNITLHSCLAGRINYGGINIFSLGQFDNFFLKIDSNGHVIAFQPILVSGGGIDETPSKAITDSAGNVYLTGGLGGSLQLSNLPTIPYRGGNSDPYLIKYGLSGCNPDDIDSNSRITDSIAVGTKATSPRPPYLLQLIAYPNPAQDQLTLELLGAVPAKGASLSIYAYSGQRLRTLPWPDGSTSITIDLEGLGRPGYKLFLLEQEGVPIAESWVRTGG